MIPIDKLRYQRDAGYRAIVNKYLMAEMTAQAQQQGNQQGQQQGSSSSSGAGGLGALAGLYGAYKGADKLGLFGGGEEAASATASSLNLPSTSLSSEALLNARPDALTNAEVLGIDTSGIGGDASSAWAGADAAAVPGYYSIAGPAGMALGGYGVYNATKQKDKKRGALQGALSGAGFGAGTGMTLAALGIANPALIPLALGGAALGGGLGGILAHKTTKEKQEERWQKAIEGNDSARSFYEQLKAKEKDSPNYSGRVDNSQASDFIGINPSSGQWTNNKFAQSRNEADLRPEDVWGSQDFFNNVPDWLTKYSEDQRRRAAQALLDQKMIDERKGGLYFTDDNKAKSILNSVLNGK